MNNNLINELNNKIDAQDKIINTQALEIARLKEDKKKAIEYISNSWTGGIIVSSGHKVEEIDLDELLEILGDKENETN